MSKEETKNPVGRPSKYDGVDLEQVEKLAALGLIDREIAYVLDISEVTLNKYKKTPEFLQSLKKGKLVADKNVIESLYQRAMGYTHPEEKLFMHNGKVVRAQTVKQYAPDAVSMIFWLKNRRPDLWRDKLIEINQTVKNEKYITVYLPGKGKKGSRDGVGAVPKTRTIPEE